jgi:hypothetical protein
MENAAREEVSVVAKTESPAPMTLTTRESAAIRRLMDEVKHEDTTDLSAHYNRMHNRHNR